MLYVIGGASRSGKTLLARRAVAEKHIPYFPLDGLFNVLAERVPQLGVTYNQSLSERPVKMWPMTKQLFDYFLKEEREYLIEGDALLPQHISQLIVEGKPIKCCFLGYAEVTSDEKLALVRRYHQGEIDWTKDITDEEMLVMIDEMIEFSKQIQEDCVAHGIRYFDVSHDFEGARNAAFEHLFSK